MKAIIAAVVLAGLLVCGGCDSGETGPSEEETFFDELQYACSGVPGTTFVFTYKRVSQPCQEIIPVEYESSATCTFGEIEVWTNSYGGVSGQMCAECTGGDYGPEEICYKASGGSDCDLFSERSYVSPFEGKTGGLEELHMDADAYDTILVGTWKMEAVSAGDVCKAVVDITAEKKKNPGYW